MTSFFKIYKSKLAASGLGVGYGGTNTLQDSNGTSSFLTTVSVGDVVTAGGTSMTGTVVSVVSDTDLILSADVMNAAGGMAAYEIFGTALGTEYSMISASQYLFAYSTTVGEIIYTYADNITSSKATISTNLDAAGTEAYIQSINNALGNLENGTVMQPTYTLSIQAPVGTVVLGVVFV